VQGGNMSYPQARSLGGPPSAVGLNLYLLFMVSWFLHLPARLEFLGTIRFDLLLVGLLIGLAVTTAKPSRRPSSEAERVLRVLIMYAIVTVPFVYWPGSVIKFGLPNFVKAIVFFYFTIAFVKTEADLRKVVFAFVFLQLLRILEPLYLHLAHGYWGSRASMANWESMDRLSGAPSDVINPNGLAFLVCTVLPFLYFLAGLSRTLLTAALLLAPPCLYVLALTGSRSGIIGLLVVMLGIVMKSKSRASFVAGSVLGLILAGVGFAFLSPDLQDRYLSLIGLGEKNEGTLEDRLEGMMTQIDVMMNAPIVGHGLGTSAEANSNFTTSGPYAGWAIPAHNLYLEIGQELGVFGIIIYLVYIKSIFSGFAKSRRVSWHHDAGSFVPRLIDAMQVWLIMNLVFSFASYGLSSYEWYLFGGLSVVLQRLAESKAKAGQDEAPERAGKQEWIGAAGGRRRWSS
jgi:hypothetical protein